MDASRRRVSTLAVGVLSAIAAADARACGELMLRSLGAMRFHAFTTKHPGTVLLYAGEIASQWPEATGVRLREALARAGHDVHQARGQVELGQMVVASRYDVLVAYADDMWHAAGQIDKATGAPALIPVIDSTAPNEREMRERYPRLVTGGLYSLLRAIEQARTEKA